MNRAQGENEMDKEWTDETGDELFVGFADATPDDRIYLLTEVNGVYSTPTQAREIAQHLIDCANEIERTK